MQHAIHSTLSSAVVKTSPQVRHGSIDIVAAGSVLATRLEILIVTD
jgi:hypothetical protein